jgi:hypothetical protein
MTQRPDQRIEPHEAFADRCDAGRGRVHALACDVPLHLQGERVGHLGRGSTTHHRAALDGETSVGTSRSVRAYDDP